MVLSVDDNIDADLYSEEHLSPNPLPPIHTPVGEQRDYESPQRDTSLSPIPTDYVALDIGARSRRAEHNGAISPLQNLANFDSLSSTDFPFSQEQAQLACEDSCDDLSETSDDKSISVSDSELVSLGCERNRMLHVSNHTAGTTTVIQDHFSALFNDYVSECVNAPPGTDLEFPTQTQEMGQAENVSRNIPENTELPDWEYESPFKTIELEIDVVDTELCPKYIQESNAILDNVIEKASVLRDMAVDASNLRRLDAFDCFIPLSTLEKLRANINEVLNWKKKKEGGHI